MTRTIQALMLSLVFLAPLLAMPLTPRGGDLTTVTAVTDDAAEACAEDLELAAACGRCGDGFCNPSCGESAASCPRDCGVVEEAVASNDLL